MLIKRQMHISATRSIHSEVINCYRFLSLLWGSSTPLYLPPAWFYCLYTPSPHEPTPLVISLQALSPCLPFQHAHFQVAGDLAGHKGGAGRGFDVRRLSLANGPLPCRRVVAGTGRTHLQTVTACCQPARITRFAHQWKEARSSEPQPQQPPAAAGRLIPQQVPQECPLAPITELESQRLDGRWAATSYVCVCLCGQIPRLLLRADPPY